MTTKKRADIHKLFGTDRGGSLIEKGIKKPSSRWSGRLVLIDMPQRTLPPLPFQPLRAIFKGDLLNHKAEKAVK
jgi:hypothetical protein